jgi:hypothetical protein
MEGLGKEYFIQAVDITGSIVFDQVMVNTHGNQLHQISVSDWNGGIYFLRIISGNKSLTRKLIINH